MRLSAKLAVRLNISVLLFLVLTIFTVSNAFSAQNHTEIINGKPVTSDQIYARSTVAVGGPTELACSAVIIHKNFILTAAHCKTDIEIGGRVYFGTDRSNFVYRKIISVTAFPEYCANGTCGQLYSTDDNDIVIAQFEGDLPEGFVPVQIAPQSMLVSGQKIVLAGYGRDESGKYQDTLRATTVPFDQMNGVSEFKTDETAAGSCNGDSGGPAYIEQDGKLLLAGLTSRGDGPCRRLGIYTMVDYFSMWIFDIITASEL